MFYLGLTKIFTPNFTLQIGGKSKSAVPNNSYELQFRFKCFVEILAFINSVSSITSSIAVDIRR